MSQLHETLAAFDRFVRRRRDESARLMAGSESDARQRSQALDKRLGESGKRVDRLVSDIHGLLAANRRRRKPAMR